MKHPYCLFPPLFTPCTGPQCTCLSPYTWCPLFPEITLLTFALSLEGSLWNNPKQFVPSSHNNVGVCFQVRLSLDIVVPQSTNCLETNKPDFGKISHVIMKTYCFFTESNGKKINFKKIVTTMQLNVHNIYKYNIMIIWKLQTE